MINNYLTTQTVSKKSMPILLVVIGLLLNWLTVFSPLLTAAPSKLNPPKGILAMPGKTAPTFTLKDMEGKSFDSNSLKGHWSFIHFWASWCGPCRKELPAIEKLITTFKKSKLKIVLINTAETEDTVFNFFGKLGVDIDTLLDTDGKVTEQWKPRGLPTTVLVDPQGKIRYLVIGGRPWDKAVYQNFLRALLKVK
ncbi:hypothetical protein MNBD_GAMMA12-318 [hydrothermal vent metagenome]|uniref:Thioredoxin domain-containing protein n=1 Tax=hydrothermal vent metagenome TaxID=652676 RepID=A0A3B0YQW1_9ZZZZ